MIKTIANQIAIKGNSRTYALETLKGYTKAEIADIMEVVYQGVKGYGQEIVLPVPILIIVGDGDQTGKVQTYCQQWAERENRNLIVIPNASHNANMDNPNEFNRILDEFLSKAGS